MTSFLDKLYKAFFWTLSCFTSVWYSAYFEVLDQILYLFTKSCSNQTSSPYSCKRLQKMDMVYIGLECLNLLGEYDVTSENSLPSRDKPAFEV